MWIRGTEQDNRGLNGVVIVEAFGSANGNLITVT